jgi:hypothetical protein
VGWYCNALDHVLQMGQARSGIATIPVGRHNQQAATGQVRSGMLWVES